MAFITPIFLTIRSKQLSPFSCQSSSFITSAIPRRSLPLNSQILANNFYSSSPIKMLEEGQQAPTFTAEDVDGKSFSLDSSRDRNLVLYFSNAGGAVCKAQSCSFRDAEAQFNSLDADIVAVAAKKKPAATSFRDSNGLTFPVLPDPDGSLQKLFGVPATLGLLPGRVTFVIDKQGVVRKVYNSQMSSSEHVRVAKEALEKLSN